MIRDALVLVAALAMLTTAAAVISWFILWLVHGAIP